MSLALMQAPTSTWHWLVYGLDNHTTIWGCITPGCGRAPRRRSISCAASALVLSNNDPAQKFAQLMVPPLAPCAADVAGLSRSKSHISASHSHFCVSIREKTQGRLGSHLTRALQNRPSMQKALLVLALLGVSMVIGDGVLTAAASVMSAMSGLQVADSSISNSEHLLLTQGPGSQQLLLHCGNAEIWALMIRSCTTLTEVCPPACQFPLCCTLLICPQQAAQGTVVPGVL